MTPCQHLYTHLPFQSRSRRIHHRSFIRTVRIYSNQEPSVSILASSLALGNADYSWRRESLCADTDPELFFPIGTTGQALLQIAKAKEVCSGCTVKSQCLDFALETNQDSGIWGGTSEEERRNIRRERAARLKARPAV
ncbi:MAG: WhiB family transcriptional regulator [Actinobacteria bacterium]|nr:WhiB family transcriptional regulator [Actinomycetota bacterium]